MDFAGLHSKEKRLFVKLSVPKSANILSVLLDLQARWRICGERERERERERLINISSEIIVLNSVIGHNGILIPYIQNSIFSSTQNWMMIRDSLYQHAICAANVRKSSSSHGIVRPLRCSNPNSSSAFLNNAWKVGCFKYDVGITNRFRLSPT